MNARKAKGNNADGVAVEDELSRDITRGLGGKKNIDTVDCCATRLRCTVINPDLVMMRHLKLRERAVLSIKVTEYRLSTDLM